MKRIPPSRRIDQKISEVLESGGPEGEDVLGLIVRLATQQLVQLLLEEEVEDYLGRGHYERRKPDQEHRGYRNGYAEYKLKTAEGVVPVYVPELRDTSEPYRSRLMGLLRQRSKMLTALALQMWARGLSTRDIEDAFKDITGECLISRSGVSRVTEELWEQYQAFRNRSLAGFQVEYLFLDAIYESLREQAGIREGILCAWGILRSGRRVLLHLDLGNKESYEAWLEFLRDMVRRGLNTPVSVTTDGAPGLTKAVEAMWPRSVRIRCWVHKMRNVLDKVRDEDKEEVKEHLRSIRDAASYEIGEMLSEEFISRYRNKYPSAVHAWADDVEASLAHLKLPAVHRKYVRTTNLIERSFEEERRRSKVIPRFFDEKSCLKLVFATLIQASQRWRRIRFSEHEQAQICKLRVALGIDRPEESSVGVAAE